MAQLETDDVAGYDAMLVNEVVNPEIQGLVVNAASSFSFPPFKKDYDLIWFQDSSLKIKDYETKEIHPSGE